MELKVSGLHVDGGGGVPILDRFTKSFQTSMIYVVMGENGAGKSTVLKTLADDRIRAGGEIWFDDRDISTRGRERLIEYISQDYTQCLFPWKSVAQNIGAGCVDATRVKEAIHHFDLARFEGRFPYQLSGGEQRRILLARAYVSAAPILLLDEIFVSFDCGLTDKYLLFLREVWRSRGKVVITVMHDPSQAALLADEVIVCAARPLNIVAEIPRGADLRDFRTRIQDTCNDIYGCRGMQSSFEVLNA